MKPDYLVSVIIPVFNAEETIGKTLESICKQTYKNIEIIAINDGSFDKSLNILKEYEKKCNMTIVSIENSGVSTARNIGIDKAKGEFITFVDSDDIIDEKMIEKMVNSLQYNDAKLAICGMKISYYSSKRVKNIEVIPCIDYIGSKEQFNSTFGKLFYTKIYLSIWGKLYNLALIKKNNIKFDPNIKIGEDMLFNYAYFKIEFRSNFVREPLYVYEIRNHKSLTKNYTKDRLDNNIYLLEQSIDFLNRLNINDESAYKSVVKYFYVSSLLVVQGQLQHRIDCRNAINDIKTQIMQFDILRNSYRDDFELKVYQWAFTCRALCAVRFVAWLRMLLKKIFR